MVELAGGVDSKSRLTGWDDLMRCGEKWISIPGYTRAEQGPRLGELQLLVFAKLQWQAAVESCPIDNSSSSDKTA